MNFARICGVAAMTERNPLRPQCHAKSKTTGEQCGRSPIPGGTVCWYHGGAKATTRAAGQRRLAEAKLEKELQDTLGKLKLEPVGDPLTALQMLAAEVVAWKELVAARVAELKSLGYSGEYGEQIRAEVTVFERALDRAVSTLATIARLNIDERLATITAAQKLMIIRAVEAALASAGISGPAADRAKQVAGKHLRIIEGGAAA